MVEIDFDNVTYVCPYCGCKQSYGNKYTADTLGYDFNIVYPKETDINVYHIKCSNGKCSRITVVARDVVTKKTI